jgi:site-specific recombinase XerD
MSINDTAKEILLKTVKKIDGAYAPNTIRAYKSNYESFINYCDEINEKAYPASHETILGFIKTISDGRLKSSSIKIVVASISAIHRFNSKEDQTQHADVKIEIAMQDYEGYKASLKCSLTPPNTKAIYKLFKCTMYST